MGWVIVCSNALLYPAKTTFLFGQIKSFIVEIWKIQIIFFETLNHILSLEDIIHAADLTSVPTDQT